MTRPQMTTEQFKKKIRERYPEKDWDLSPVIYDGVDSLITIRCREKDSEGNEHGEFTVTAKYLIGCKTCPCKKCAKEAMLTERGKRVIGKAKEVHNGKNYTYDKFLFTGMLKYATVTCHEKDENGEEHGDFPILPNNLIHGCGCPKCKIESQRNTTEWFIGEARKIHGDKYDYSQAIYKGYNKPVKIGCEKHGWFWQVASHHLAGCGCKKCADETKSKTTEQFIEEAREIHGDFYDYSRTKYKNNDTKVEIGCPVHGYFLQLPRIHLSRHGCPYCNESRMERDVRLTLENLGIEYIQWEQFEWLGQQEVDFYLPDCGIAIECQGKQHYEPLEHFGGEERFYEQVERDRRKKQLCEENSLPLFYIRYDESVEEALRRILSEIGICFSE